MNNLLLKIISTFLIAASFFTVLVSCGNNSSKTDYTDTVTLDDDYPDNLSDKKYNGRKITLLVPTEVFSEFTLDGEESEAEDAISAAVLKRNQLVCGSHAVELEFLDGGDINAYLPKILAEAQAGDGAYDIIAPSYWWNAGTDGVVVDLSEVEVMDFSGDWWYSYINEALVYPSGKQYYCTGALNRLDISSAGMVFFNKNVFSDAHGDYNILFDKVRNGEWTKDLALEYAQIFGSDIDMNGTMDENDSYGIIVCNGVRMLSSWGIKFTYAQNSDGTYSFNFFTNKFIEKYQELTKFYNNSHVGYTDDWLSWPCTAFANDRVMFLFAPLNCYDIVSEANAQYGILPLPKYDEKQKDYITYGYGIILDGIMTTVDDVECSAVVLQSLNYYSLQEVMPAFKETTLKIKKTDDDDAGSKEMLDIIYRTTSSEFAFVHDDTLKISNLVTGRNPSIASVYRANETIYNQALNDILLGEEQ